MPPKTIKECPICGKPADVHAKCYPFCSDRCQLIDLANWSSEKYVIHRPLRETDERHDAVDPDEEQEM